MDRRYKIIISNDNKIYREIELAPDARELNLGTGIDCDVRLHKDLVFEPIKLTFVKSNDEEWSVLCSDNLYLTVGDVRKLMTKRLTHGDQFAVKYQQSNNTVFNVEFLIDFDNGQQKYERIIDVSKASTVNIGTARNNNIVLSSSFVTDDQIMLRATGEGLEINIGRTTYGVYHNGRRAANREIIRNMDFFSVSDYFFYYKNGKIWAEIRPDLVVNGLNYKDSPRRNQYPKFNRSTRMKTTVCEDKIDVLDPPAKPQKPKNNLIMRLLPSLGMLIASGVMAVRSGPGMMIMSGISGVMAIVTAILTFRESKKDYKEGTKTRIEKYNAYIEKKRGEIEACRAEEKKSLEQLYLSQEVESRNFREFSPSLFDRRIEDEDFLCVKLGDGMIPARRKVEYKKQERLEVEDELQLIPEKLHEEYQYLSDAPVTCNLKATNAIGIVGSRESRFALLKNIVIDVAARQYYTDVKMVFVCEKENAEKIRWLRMLPHVNNDAAGMRNIVTDDESRNAVFEYLYRELTFREQSKSKTFDSEILVFFYDEYGFKSHPISKFVDKAAELGATFLFFADKKADTPLGCNYLIESDKVGQGRLVSATDSQSAIDFTYNEISDGTARKIVELLAPVYTEEISLEGTLTKNISLFQLLNIIAVDDLNLTERWESTQVYKSMAAPIGVTKSGIVNLDLHDKAHGPHGLVAGTTGSGKSEILQTYILSMATLFSPYEVGFVIIDFKGGGMVNQFRDLPHLLGAITNIDGKEIDRSLKSIKAELQKRQRLFAEADVNHIDKYIRKFKSGEVKTPLPHLILIVDEFAELKAEQPEFMKELISAARIGRSLGVHLILATQKPSGQVNEQIWSNSRFKLCLKVQSQEDSNEVLKSPLAAEIKEPGRAYLQVGNNEVFELFQSAYSGASEKMYDNTVKEFSISSLTDAGRRTVIYRQKNQKPGENTRTQLDAIVDYVASYCKGNGIERLPNICLPSLKDAIDLPETQEAFPLEAIPIGVYDDPDTQYQGEGRFDFFGRNNLVIGASQMGKTNLIQTIIKQAASHYSPKDFVLYIADFGSMFLRNFEDLHHVGGVVTISENEKFKNLFKLLTEEVNTRKARFLEKGLSSYGGYLEAGYTDLPYILFIMENFSAFKEIYADEFEDQLLYLSREGLSCGISLLITNASTNGISYRYTSNFAGRFALPCTDAGDYSSLFERCRMQPKETPGRLLCQINKEIYELQSYLAFHGEKEVDRSRAVSEFTETINRKYPRDRARKIPCIPDQLTAEYVRQNYPDSEGKFQYVIGLDYANVGKVCLDLLENTEFCVVGKDKERKFGAVRTVLEAVHRRIFQDNVKLYIIDNMERRLKPWAELSYVEKYTIDYSCLEEIFQDMMPELEERYEKLMDGEQNVMAKQSLYLIVINNKDAIEYISGNRELLEMYKQIVKRYKSMGVAFLFTDIDDVTAGYNSPELLRSLKDRKKAVIVNKIEEVKFFEIPSSFARANKSANASDAYIINESDIGRIKLIEGGV